MEPIKNGKEALGRVFKSEARDKLLVEKNKTYLASVDGTEFTVNYKPAAKLRRLYRENLYLDYEYAPEDAVFHVLTREEVIEREEAKFGEKFWNTDAFAHAEPELDLDVLEKMSNEEKLERFAVFTDFCNRVATDEILQKIAEAAPKKKNKTLSKGKVFRIAGYMAVNSFSKMMMLVGRAKTDTELEITVEERTFDAKEIELVISNAAAVLQSGDESECSRNMAGISTEIEISYSYSYNAKRKTERFTLPAVFLENGRKALRAEPYIALSDFECLSGNDRDGYTFTGYTPFEKQTVIFNEKELTAFCSNTYGYDNGWVIRIRDLKKQAAYVMKKKGKLSDAFPSGISPSDIDKQMYNKKYFTIEAISEHAYELFVGCDMVTKYFRNIDPQKIADCFPRWEDSGRLKQSWYVCMYDIGEDTDLYSLVTATNGENLNRYLNEHRFSFRRRPMRIPYVYWSGRSVFEADVRWNFNVEWEV